MNITTINEKLKNIQGTELGVATNAAYWSSSQSDNNYGWRGNNQNGSLMKIAKTGAYRVRLVRDL